MVAAISTVDYDIVGSYNNQRVNEIDSERSVNCFEYLDMRGKKKKALLGTSGLFDPSFAFPNATGGFRAQFVFLGDEYHVIGNRAYKIAANGSIAELGVFANSIAGYVGIDANTFQVIFVDGVNGYIWDTQVNTWEKITDPAFPALPIDVTYLDGFFTVANGNTNAFQLSTFNQGLIWGSDSGSTFTMTGANLALGGSGNFLNYQVGTPVDFSGGSLPSELVAGTTYYVVSSASNTIQVSATKNGVAITSAMGGSGTVTNNGQLQLGQITSHPGTIVACRTLHRRLFLFSQNFTEVWENQGAANLPFRRNNSLLMEYGTPALGSIAVGFDKMIFLSQDRDGLGPVMEVAGTQAMPISTTALDNQLTQYAALQQLSDCRAFLLRERGIIFYRMNFTAANHTFIYNVTMSDPSSDENKRWHEEEVLNGDRHPAQTHAYFNGLNYVGSYNSPVMYVLSAQIYTNNGENIRRMRIGRPECPEGYQRRRIDRFQLDMQQGNVQNIIIDQEEQPILTENGFELLTENGLTLLAEQDFLSIDAPSLFVFLSISKDGGQSYGNPLSAPMGTPGQRTFRTLWRKLGTTKRGQAFVPKIEFFQAVPFVILGASWASEILPE